MKKKILLIATLVISSYSIGQIAFSENFDGSSSIPSGWGQYNLDGLTPINSEVGTAGWIAYPNSIVGSGNVMLSTSSYNPAGTSNDWLISPMVSIPASGYKLYYDVIALDQSNPDGYEVYISSMGNSVSSFIGSPIYSENAAPSSFTERIIDLSTYAGQSVYIAFRNNSNDQYFLFLDNVVVRKLQQNDVILENCTLNRYSMTNTDNTLSMSITNNGANAISSVTVDWNDGTAHSQTISVSIAPGETQTVQHPTSVNYSTVVGKTISITISQVNSMTDPTSSNNSTTVKFNTISSKPPKQVVFEEGTGTWCQACVRGAVAMEFMHANHPDFIGIAVHNQDPMVVAAYDNGISSTLSFYPGANIDRTILASSVDNNTFESAYNDRKDLVAPAEIDAMVSGTGSGVTLDVSTTFRSVFTGAGYRLAAVIIEDSIIGNSSGYDQHNAYSGGGWGPLTDVNGLDYTALPSIIPHETYKFNHVSRAILGTYSGAPGSVPSSIADGQVITYSFNYTIPSTSNRENMRAAILLIDHENGQIVNAKEVELSESAGQSVLISDIDLNVYPNPITEHVSVSFYAENENYSITISDITGKVIFTRIYSNLTGNQLIDIPTNEIVPGNYLLEVSTNGASFNKHIIIQ